MPELLANPGNILVLFPEGTRTSTGEMGEFKPGIGLLVAGTEIPVVPCHLAGAFEAWPKGVVIPRPRKLRLQIGSPLTFENFAHCKTSSESVGEQLRDAVSRLADQNPEAKR